MKISVIIASFNRPSFLREALRSIVNQTHSDYQAVIVDESNAFNIFDLVKEFKFTESTTIHTPVSPEQRSKVNRLGANINIGLRHAIGDLICYLADDDAFFPTWFEKASAYFGSHAEAQVGFGILKYCENTIELSEMGEIRWWDEVIPDPMGRLDHNQVIHRKFDPVQKWSENVGTEMNVDGWFFSQLANFHKFHPINAWAAAKRIHGKNLQSNVPLYQSGKMDGLRE